MAEKEESASKTAIGPSVVLGLVGAVVVLLLLGAGVWGVGKIISKVRESKEETSEEETAENEEEEEGEGEGEGEEEESDGEEEAEASTVEEGEEVAEATEDGDEGEVGDGAVSEEGEEDTDGEEDTEEEGEETMDRGDEGGVSKVWSVIDYKKGDIKGDTYTVVWGDTLWEIAEARYGSGFEWVKIKDANLDKVGYLPNGSRALIIPGQVLTLP